MQKLNTNYILLSVILMFASPKKAYAETEINPETEKPSQAQEQQIDSENLERQQEILRELLGNLENETQQDNSASDQQSASSPSEQGEIAQAMQNLTPEQQEQIINTIVTTLTPQEQQAFIELLEEATIEKPTDQNLLEKLFEKIDGPRCLSFCIKLSLAILFWEVVQKSDFVDNNKIFPKSAQELFKAFTTVLFVDDIKDFVKEVKKIVEGECQLLYKKLYVR